MPSFTCILNTNSLPAEVRRGETIRANVVAVSYSAPIGSVIIEATGYGVNRRLKQVSENMFQLELHVPFLVPPGNYRYAIWAVSKTGEAGAKQPGSVIIR